MIIRLSVRFRPSQLNQFEMWKYIVIWCLSSIVFDESPRWCFDEFGRQYECPIKSHWEIVCGKNKHFYNRDSAFIFYNRALKESKIDSSLYYIKQIDAVKIDSTFIKKP
jgi:hypothetical protein